MNNNGSRAQEMYHRGLNLNIPDKSEEMHYTQDYNDAYGKLSSRGKSGSGNHRDSGGSGSQRAQGHIKANSMQIVMGYPQKQKKHIDDEDQQMESFGLKNSHIVMNQQHVKMKQGKNHESGSPMMQEKIASFGGQKVMQNQAPVPPMQPGAQLVSHKKANSLMNQKMMQLLLNKDQSNGATIENTYAGSSNNQALKANPGTFHAQTPNIMNTDSGLPVYHHMKSKSFMNDFISASADHSQPINPANRPIPSTVIKPSKKAQNMIGSSPNMSTVAVPRGQIQNVMQSDGMQKVKKKIAPTIQQSQLKSKIISNSFDKTSGGPQILKTGQKLGMKLQSFQNKITKKPLGSSNMKHPSTGMPTNMQSGFVTGMMSAGMVTQGQVSGHQSIMTVSTHNLHQGADQRVIVNNNIASNHQRTSSDANNIQTNTSGKNFVISSSNHVYPTSNQGQKITNKKSSNLKSMSNNNQVSSQGATKGLLKQSKIIVGQRAAQVISASRPVQQQTGHKKNQYSTIVKSNYQNLVSDTEFQNNDYSENEETQQQKPPLVDLEVFNSSQNKTTEQKYAELKLKYNDLLSKHFALATQKTEDNRDSKYKQTLDGQYYGGGINISRAPVQQFIQSENVKNLHGQAHTTQQSLEPPQIIMNQSNGSQGGLQRRGVSIGSKGTIQGNPGQYYDECSNQMISFVDPESLIHQSGMFDQIGTGVHSNERSHKQTPRGNEMKINYRVPETTQILSEGNSQKASATKFVVQNQVFSINLKDKVAQSINSRTEATRPLISKSNQQFSDDSSIAQKRFVIAGASRAPLQYSVNQKVNSKNHKRSVSDGGVFNNLGLKNKVIKAAESFNQHNEISYNQQKIPMKEKSMQNSQKSFDHKINEIRQSNGLPRIQQNMVIQEEGDDEPGATMFSQNSNNEENIHTEIGQEHSLEFNVNPQPEMNMMLKKQSIRYNNASNLSKDEINPGQVRDSMRIKKKKTRSLVGGYEESSIPRYEQSEMNSQIKKYKQKRKSGEYGQTHTGQIISHMAPNGETYIEIQNDQRDSSHRRVKSGVSEQVQPKLVPGKVILFKNNKVQTSQTKANQNSLKLLREQNGRANQFMMIQEDEQIATEEFLQLPDESVNEDAAEPFGPCQFSQNNNKKVINVSFNDFNQSMSNEYEDVSKDNIHYSRQNSTDGFGGLVKQTQQSSNKNLNNFLEALQKIKPQNPIVSISPKKIAGHHKKMNSEIAITNELQHEIKISSISGNNNQLKLEKYQKMMQKVKQNDKNLQLHSKVGQSIKKREYINFAEVQNKPKTMSPPQKMSARDQSIKQHGTPDLIQGSGHDLKITFVGDQKLMNLQKKQVKSIKTNLFIQAPNDEHVQFNQNKAKHSGLSTMGMNSNTGGQPSPIISTKRVPQKFNAQGDRDDTSPAEPRSIAILQNNFMHDDNTQIQVVNAGRQSITPGPGDSSSYDDQGKVKQKQQPSQGQKRKARKEINIHEADQQYMIQNLNKSDRIEEEKHIHIIQHPVPSGFKIKGQQMQQNTPQAPQVSERLVTDDSTYTGLTPRSTNIRKLIKLITLGFRQKTPIPPATTIDFYRIGKILGKGAFGKVNLAIHKLTQCVCAIKSINKQFFSDESQTKKVMQEVVMLKKTRHQNIVRLYEYFETEKHILFVIELCAGGDLLNYVRRRRRLKEDVAKCLFKQIIESLAYCHSKSILHRDIKLDNILLDANGQVKLCDFGVGKIVKKGEKMTEQCGTPAYIAPEILRNKGYYGFKVDIWSAGVVLYAMLYGTVPFKSSNMTGLQEIITKAKYSLKDDISQESRDLLKGLLEKDPQKRLGINQILSHPWLKDAVGASEIELFTEQEIQYIKSEFSYGKSSRYGRNKDGLANSDPIGMSSTPGLFNEPINHPSDLDKDMFTEHMLDSTQNSILKNCETKSVILAPFNSTKSNLQEGEDQPPIELSDSVKEMMESRRIIKYGPRVRDIDKQYEINNNADLDNGVYHKFDEDENLDDQEQDENVESEVNEQDEIDYDPEEREILQQLKNQGKKAGKKKQSELQRLENMIHDQEEKEKETTPVAEESPISEQLMNSLQSDISPDKNKNALMIIEGNPPTEESYISSPSERLNILYYQSQIQNETLVIDEGIMNIIGELGYPRDYLVKCINQAELNYASTSYWLLYFTKRMLEIGERWEKERQQKEKETEQSNTGLILIFKEVAE